MLAPSLLPHLATSGTEPPQLFSGMPCSSKMRSSPGPSCSNNDSHDVTGIAPSALGNHDTASKSHAAPGDLARSGTRPASEDCQCSADSLNPSTKNAALSSGAPSAAIRQQAAQRMPHFPEGPLPVFAKAPEPAKAAPEPPGAPKTVPASSSSDFKRPRAMDYKKSRMVWSEELHSHFLRALSDIGLRHAVPKTIMQRMGVDTLTRENVASHLQKYRLALKRKANLPDNALMTASSWRLLEQAHEDVVNNLPPPAAPAAPLSAAALNITPSPPLPCSPPPGSSPNAPGASSAAATTISAAASAPTAAPRRPTTPLPPLPPLMPSQAKLAPYPELHSTPSGQNSHTTLPPGFSVPLPNSDGLAVGIPMPIQLIPKQQGATPTVQPQKPSSLPPMATSMQPPASGLPDLPPVAAVKQEPAHSSMPPLHSQGQAPVLAEGPASLPHGAAPMSATHAADAAAATDPMCTVYMLNPTSYAQQPGQLPPLCGPHQAHGRTLVKPTQVPQMLLSVSAAAYGGLQGAAASAAAAAPAAAAHADAAPPSAVAHGAPVETLSSGSASRPADGTEDEEASQPLKRRRRVSVRVERLPGEEDFSPRRKAKATKVARTSGSNPGVSAAVTAAGVAAGVATGVSHGPIINPVQAQIARANARELNIQTGSCSALDALAEVAGMFADGEAL